MSLQPPSSPEPSLPAPPSYIRPSRRTFPRTLRGWLITSGIAILLLLLVAWMLARKTPGWYSPLDPTSNRVLDDADVAQRKLALDLHNAVQRVPLGEQKWSITQDEINSLLAIKFAPPPPPPPSDPHLTPAGSPSEGAQTGSALGVSGPFIVFSPGKITVAVRALKAPGRDAAGGVVSVVFVVQTTVGGAGSGGSPVGLIKIDGAYVGALPVPKSLVEKRMRAAVPGLAAVVQQTLTYQLGVKDSASLMPEVTTAIRAVSEGEPFPLSFVSDHRQVLVKDIRVDDGLLTVVFGPPSQPPLKPSSADLLPQGR